MINGRLNNKLIAVFCSLTMSACQQHVGSQLSSTHSSTVESFGAVKNQPKTSRKDDRLGDYLIPSGWTYADPFKGGAVKYEYKGKYYSFLCNAIADRISKAPIPTISAVINLGSDTLPPNLFRNQPKFRSIANKFAARRIWAEVLPMYIQYLEDINGGGLPKVLETLDKFYKRESACLIDEKNKSIAQKSWFEKRVKRGERGNVAGVNGKESYQNAIQKRKLAIQAVDEYSKTIKVYYEATHAAVNTLYQQENIRKEISQ